MKLFKLFTLMAAGTMIMACNNEIENLSQGVDNRVLSLQTAGKAYTRFNDAENKWESTDKIGVYMYGAGADNTTVLNGAENVSFSTAGGGSSVNFISETGIQIADENAKFAAYYPQSEGVVGGIYKIELDNQSAGYAAHDLMWAVSDNVNSEAAKTLSLTFKHQLAKLVIEVTPKGSETVNSISIQGLSTNADFNIATGKLSNETKGFITPYKIADNKYSALILPVNPATDLSMIITTDAAENNTYEYTFSSGSITELKAGYIYTIKIGLGESVLGNVGQIEGGNSPYEPGGDVTGDAGNLTPEFPGYVTVEAPAADKNALESCLNGKSGAIALKFVAGNTYTADNIIVPAGITGLMLVGTGEVPVKVVMKGLSVGERQLEKLALKNIEIEGDKSTTLCVAELKSDATLIVEGCYIHGVKAVYGRGETAAKEAHTALDASAPETAFARLASVVIDDSRIYNVSSIFDCGVTQAVAITNSTFFNVSGVAFHSYKTDATKNTVKQSQNIKVTDCTLVDMGSDFMKASGGYGSLAYYENNISSLKNSKNCITYGIKPTTSPAIVAFNNFAVAGTGSTIKDYTDKSDYTITTEILDTTKAESEIFVSINRESGKENFTPVAGINAGDPRWKNNN